jgi:hypothetical protein
MIESGDSIRKRVLSNEDKEGNKRVEAFMKANKEFYDGTLPNRTGGNLTESDRTTNLEKAPKFRALDNAQLQQEFGESMIGKPMSEVVKLVKQKYGDKVPGLQDREYLVSNPNNFPQLKDGNYYYFLRGQVADGDVPCAHWAYGEFVRAAFPLDYKWSEYDRVLLLE